MSPTLITNPTTFDAALRRLARAHVLQTSHWAALKAPTWSSEHYLWGSPEQPDSAATILTRRLGRLPIRIQYVPKGPVTTDPGQWQDRLSWLEQHAASSGALFIKIDPDIDEESEIGQHVVGNLGRRGWVFSREQIQFRSTVVSDLSAEEDVLLAEMKQKTRYNIRLAGRKGVQVRISDDYVTFYQLYAQTAARDGFLIRPQDYYQTVMPRMQGNGLGQLLLAEVEGEAVAGLFLFRLGATAWYFYGASSNAHRKLMPNYLLQWEAMRWAKDHGCSRYDWWGAPDERVETDPMWGVYRFKEGFGGRYRRWIGAWDYAPRPRLYYYYTQMMPKVLHAMRRRA
ncbi:MAG: peptidoglycan bridge formation glycyltransferase FemA/FemB family protein [Chloroflexi bacterium]|nr:peptidoglycan bridge formation glycyltransferase FemA/FemB family protein [Chloroflexota bacterium]